MHADAVEFRPALGNIDIARTCMDECLHAGDEEALEANLTIKVATDEESKHFNNCLEICDYLYIPQQEAIPEANWLIEPTDEEYDRCLREKGL